MNAKFGCFHTVYENKKATEFILKEFRKYHPDAPYTCLLYTSPSPRD